MRILTIMNCISSEIEDNKYTPREIHKWEELECDQRLLRRYIRTWI